MSKNMLDPIIRALVGVPLDRLAIVADIANRLSASNGDDFHSSLADYLRNGNSAKPAPLAAPTLTLWREITVDPKSPEEFITELEQAGCYVSDYAKDIMSKPGFKTLTEPKKLKLVRCKVHDLGFKKQPSTDQIWSRIQEVNGELCPPELGPALRKEYSDQPNGDIFWLAMKQVAGSDGGPDVFGVGRGVGGGRWLVAAWTSPDRRWDLDREFVFVLRE